MGQIWFADLCFLIDVRAALVLNAGAVIDAHVFGDAFDGTMDLLEAWDTVRSREPNGTLPLFDMAHVSVACERERCRDVCGSAEGLQISRRSPFDVDIRVPHSVLLLRPARFSRAGLSGVQGASAASLAYPCLVPGQHDVAARPSCPVRAFQSEYVVRYVVSSLHPRPLRAQIM